MAFFEDVIYGEQEESGIESFLKATNLTAFNGSFYNAVGERLSYAEHKNIFDANRGMREELKEYCRYNEDARLLTIMYEMPYIGYNGQIYSSKDGKVIIDSEFMEEMYIKYPHLDYNKIETLKRLVVEYKSQKAIPPMMLPDAVPKDNGFRFPLVAYQIIKYLMFDEHSKYIFTIMSDGDMGKSTFTNFLSKLYGHEYYSADTKHMTQFSTSFYASKRLIVFNDCANDYIDNSHILKQISGGDQLQIEAKGRQGYSNSISAKMLFIGNEGITYNVLDSGTGNRFINAEWDNTIKGKKDPKWQKYEWTHEEIAYQLKLAIECEPMDYDKEQQRTIKEVLATRTAFYFDDYESYASKEKKPYSQRNYDKFFKLVSKHYSLEEWSRVKDKEQGKNYIAKSYFRTPTPIEQLKMVEEDLGF